MLVTPTPNQLMNNSVHKVTVKDAQKVRLKKKAKKKLDEIDEIFGF